LRSLVNSMSGLFNKLVETNHETFEFAATGWIPPMPDTRDYVPETEKIAHMSEQLEIKPKALRMGEPMPKAIPPAVDLRTTGYLSPIENQGGIGSCTANAAAGVVEYMEKRAFKKFLDASRLFIYKTTRNLMGVTGDTGAYLRSTMGAIAMCGVPPEKYWPYTDLKQPGPGRSRTFDEEPPSFVYSLGGNYKGINYFCHDPIGANKPRQTVLTSVQTYIAAGLPSMFGFYGFPSFNNTSIAGDIPYPCPNEQAQWGHAIVAVGYDDNKKITNTKCNKETTGALLIRNSWGTSWGVAGYGWLPYDYVLSNYACDFWSVLSQTWVDTGKFGL
jgi:C1A family cysteine protease